jgi:NarL family two-component system response regulator LiaR
MRGELAGAFGPIVSDPKELTKREKMILRCAAYGMTNEETATTVGRSVQTVKYHRTNIISKLGATNITHAVALAYEDGILGGPPRAASSPLAAAPL